jgi:hypothetical protein
MGRFHPGDFDWMADEAVLGCSSGWVLNDKLVHRRKDPVHLNSLDRARNRAGFLGSRTRSGTTSVLWWLGST